MVLSFSNTSIMRCVCFFNLFDKVNVFCTKKLHYKTMFFFFNVNKSLHIFTAHTHTSSSTRSLYLTNLSSRKVVLNRIALKTSVFVCVCVCMCVRSNSQPAIGLTFNPIPPLSPVATLPLLVSFWGSVLRPSRLHPLGHGVQHSLVVDGPEAADVLPQLVFVLRRRGIQYWKCRKNRKFD